MKKLQSRYYTVILAAIFIFSLAVPIRTRADGMILYPDPFSKRWDYLSEKDQQAFINYQNGTEKLLISITNGELKANSKAAWIFPVPGSAEKTKVDVLDGLPSFSGEEIGDTARKNLEDIKSGLQATQIYTIPWVLNKNSVKNRTPVTGTLDTRPISSFSLSESDSGQDVTVFEHLEKNGIVSEIISAKSVTAISNYLNSQGLTVEPSVIANLNSYIGKDYSFIASWLLPSSFPSRAEIVSNLNKYIGTFYPQVYEWYLDNVQNKHPEITSTYEGLIYLKSDQGSGDLSKLVDYIMSNPSVIQANTTANRKGLLVTFPTDKAFFPLIPTSAYGDKIVPATIRVVGFVTPKIFSEIKPYANTQYYIDQNLTTSDSVSNFNFPNQEFSKYTKISISAPSNKFTDDLWFSQEVPLKTHFVSFIANYPWWLFIILLELCSILAGAKSTWLVFRKYRNWKGIFTGMVIGSGGILSLFGLTIFSLFMTTKDRDEATLSQLKTSGYIFKRRLAFVALVLIVPVLIAAAVADYAWIGEYFSYHEFSSWWLIPFTLSLSLIVLIATFLVSRRVKEPYKILFDELKRKGISRWTFQPWDNWKLLYVPVFSIIFLILTWIIIRIIEIAI